MKKNSISMEMYPATLFFFLNTPLLSLPDLQGTLERLDLGDNSK